MNLINSKSSFNDKRILATWNKKKKAKVSWKIREKRFEFKLFIKLKFKNKGLNKSKYFILVKNRVFFYEAILQTLLKRNNFFALIKQLK